MYPISDTAPPLGYYTFGKTAVTIKIKPMSDFKIFQDQEWQKPSIEIIIWNPPPTHHSLNLHTIRGLWGSRLVVYIEPPLFKVQDPIVSWLRMF